MIESVVARLVNGQQDWERRSYDDRVAGLNAYKA